MAQLRSELRLVTTECSALASQLLAVHQQTQYQRRDVDRLASAKAENQPALRVLEETLQRSLFREQQHHRSDGQHDDDDDDHDAFDDNDDGGYAATTMEAAAATATTTANRVRPKKSIMLSRGAESLVMELADASVEVAAPSRWASAVTPRDTRSGADETNNTTTTTTTTTTTGGSSGSDDDATSGDDYAGNNESATTTPLHLSAEQLVRAVTGHAMKTVEAQSAAAERHKHHHHQLPQPPSRQPPPPPAPVAPKVIITRARSDMGASISRALALLHARLACTLLV